MVEFNSIAAGIDAADQMVKTAQVDPLFFKTICPDAKPMPMRWWTGSSSPTSTGM